MVLCIIGSHIFRLSACIEAWALITIAWVLKRGSSPWMSRPLSFLLHSCPLVLPSAMNLNCLLNKKHAAHFSMPLSRYHKVSREPSHTCSILYDTLNPVWSKERSLALLHPLLLILCVIACVHVGPCRTVFACANLCGHGQMRGCVSCLCSDEL